MTELKNCNATKGFVDSNTLLTTCQSGVSLHCVDGNIIDNVIFKS